MAAVDEHGELHGAGAPVVAERVEGGTHGASGEQHVVDEDHRRGVDRHRQLVAGGRRRRSHPDVVAVEGDVDRTDRNGVLEALQLGGQGFGDPRPAALQADQHDAVEAVIALGDLVSDSGQRSAHIVGAKDLLARGHVVHQILPYGPHGTRLTVVGSPAL